ncbi:MAG: hypothetical protein HKO72_11770 [Flavobacteriaceae bacterium]|nr:hypothetical protein [Bacteroidia bacterium]NNL62001.1 hypothetical protein [Flavobacteriaceae bacterium]
MKTQKLLIFTLSLFCIMGCEKKQSDLQVEVYETSASGNKIEKLTEFQANDESIALNILPEQEFQTITGFGGAFTESSAYLLNKLSKENRKRIIDAYFSKDGANYSLTRTHMNSCDFSVSNYS